MTDPRVIGVRRIGLFLLLLVAASVSAQSVIIARWPDGSSALNMNSGWCIHAGDDPAYAEPGFDDSHWQPVELHADPSVSDGVVEATSTSGELFGFDRTAAFSTEPADTIAKAAQAFGQNDDITVLKLNFAGALHV